MSYLSKRHPLKPLEANDHGGKRFSSHDSRGGTVEMRAKSASDQSLNESTDGPPEAA